LRVLQHQKQLLKAFWGKSCSKFVIIILSQNAKRLKTKKKKEEKVRENFYVHLHYSVLSLEGKVIMEIMSSEAHYWMDGKAFALPFTKREV